MAQDLTLVEDLESMFVNCLYYSSAVAFVALGVMCLLAHFSVWTVTIGTTVVLVVSFIWRTIRFGERRGRIADRTTALEMSVKRLVHGTNMAIDSIKEAIDKKSSQEVVNI